MENALSAARAFLVGYRPAYRLPFDDFARLSVNRGRKGAVVVEPPSSCVGTATDETPPPTAILLGTKIVKKYYQYHLNV
jgi:hypothetical protein